MHANSIIAKTAMDLELCTPQDMDHRHPPVDSNTSSTSEADVASLLDGADQRSHHLLKHCLSHGQRDGALAHFTTADVKEAAREVSRMGQRDLQARFKAVYGTTTHSNNNDWLRRKLYEAIGAAPMKAAVKSKPRKAAAKARSRGASLPASPVAARGALAGAHRASCDLGSGKAQDGDAALLGMESDLSLTEDGSEEGSFTHAPGAAHEAKAASRGNGTPQSVLGAACERSSWSHSGLAPALASSANGSVELPDFSGVLSDVVAADWAAEGMDLEALRPLSGYGDAADDDIMLLQLDLSAFD
ncbi:hypothetical protein ACKKBF_B20065 [Auxenochlorella protothecoides x Auxenochlorella symbiontica]